MEVGLVKRYLLCRLVPELRSIGILATDMIERLGLKLDFEKKIWWLSEKPQIRYKIESNPKENRVKWNEDEKEREPKKDCQDSSACHQMPLEEESRRIRAFTVPGKEMYQFKRMPFRLTSARATLQWLMDKIGTPKLKPNVICYLDEITVVTKNLISLNA